MPKFFAVFLSLSLISASLAAAQSSEMMTDTPQTDLDREADNLNIVSAEESLKIKRSSTKNIDLKLKHATRGEISDLIKNTYLAEKHAAQQENRAPEISKDIDPDDKYAVREMLRKNLDLDIPSYYED